MKLSAKLFRIVLPVSLILIISVYIFSRTYLLKSLMDIEVDKAYTNTQIVLNYIQRDLSNINSMNIDYAKWNDTYDYLNNRNEKYISDNFEDVTSLQRSEMSFIIITDNSGNIIYKRNIQEEIKGLFDEELYKKISLDVSRLLSNESTQNVLGIEEYRDIPFLISAERITKSDGSGTSRGVLIFVKCYEKDELDAINQSTELKTEIVKYNKDLIANANYIKKNIKVKINSKKAITSYGVINNIFGKPVFLTKLSLQRNIYSKAEDAIGLYLLILLLILLAFSLGIGLLIDILVVKKINKIKETIENVQSSQDLSSIITLKGNDEISELGSKFNNMFYRIKKSDEIIYKLAYYDILTGLPNRKKMIENCDALLKQQKGMFALLFMDLDNFKYINDNFGHEAGDLVLEEAAKRLSSVIGSQSLVSRIAGDEFIIIIENLQSTSDAALVAEKLVQALDIEFVYHENQIYISASIGISLFPEHGEDIDILIRNADLAMYEVKNSGGHGYAFYNIIMSDNAINKLELKKSLKNAIENNEFILYYQPIIDLKSEKVIKAESLIRWKKENKIISPIEFIPAAKKVGEIVAIDNWVLESACKQCKKWHKLGMDNFAVSVNVSYKQLIQLNFVQNVMDVLDKELLESRYLSIEITEDEAMEDVDIILKILSELRGKGVKISLDDFGTGYSSLSYINKLPIDVIKIDRSLISNLKSNTKNIVIVKAIIAMSHSLNIKVVAEGIETQEEFEMLKKFECDYIQGYLIGKPMAAADFEEKYIKNKQSK